MNTAKFLRRPILKNTWKRLSLKAKSLQLYKKRTSSQIILQGGFRIQVDWLWSFWNSYVDRMLPVVTGVSNIFCLAYLLFILSEKVFPILISKLLKKAIDFNDLRRNLLFLRLLKSSSKRSSFSKETSILFCISLLVFFNFSFSELWSNMNLFFLFSV